MLGCCVAKHRARNGLQISGFCLTRAQAAPDRHPEFRGYVADGEESHDSAQCVCVRGNLPLLTGQVIDEMTHPIIYILSIKAHPVIIHGG